MTNYSFVTLDVTKEDMAEDEERSKAFLAKKAERLKGIAYDAVKELKHYSGIAGAAAEILKTPYPDIDDVEDRSKDKKHLEELQESAMEVAKNLEAITDFSDDYYDFTRSVRNVYKGKKFAGLLHSAMKSLDKAAEACYGHNVKEVHVTDESGEEVLLFDAEDLAYPRKLFHNTLLLRYELAEACVVDPSLYPCIDRDFYEYLRKELIFIHNSMISKTTEECKMSDTEYLKALSAVSAGITACEMLVEEAQYCMQHDYPGENWLHFFNGPHGYSAQAAIMAAEYYAPVNSRR